MAEHCMRIIIPYPGADLTALFELEDALIEAIEAAGAGEFDGNEVGAGEATLYMYGPDADALFDATSRVLKDAPLLRTGVLLRRYGPPEEGVREVRTDLPIGALFPA